jgi:hypothetical protein
MSTISKMICAVLIPALIGQLPGCSSAPKGENKTAVPEISNSEVALRRIYGSGPTLEQNEVLLFGRLQINDRGLVGQPDLPFNAALFITTADAPHKPIPLWPKSALRKASMAFDTDKDGRFAVILPKGTWRLQVVYRSREAGWIAIDPGVQMQTSDAGAAVYVGELHIEIDPKQVAAAKKSHATTEPIRVERSEDYEADYAALTANFPDLRSMPVAHSLLTTDPKARPSAVVSTSTPPAGSESNPVIKVISDIALVALTIVLFAAYIVVGILTSGNVKFGN